MAGLGHINHPFVVREDSPGLALALTPSLAGINLATDPVGDAPPRNGPQEALSTSYLGFDILIEPARSQRARCAVHYQPTVLIRRDGISDTRLCTVQFLGG